MFLLNNIDTFWFLVSLCFGLMLVYCTNPVPDIIIKYPTPENADNLIFTDDSNNCYKFKTKLVRCPNSNKINSIPIQRKLNV